MTSFGNNIIQIEGQVYQRIREIQILPNEKPQCLYIWFVSDMKQQAEIKRVQANKNTGIDIIWNLQEKLHEKNSYVRSFKYVLELSQSSELIVKIDEAKKSPWKTFSAI